MKAKTSREEMREQQSFPQGKPHVAHREKPEPFVVRRRKHELRSVPRASSSGKSLTAVQWLSKSPMITWQPYMLT